MVGLIMVTRQGTGTGSASRARRDAHTLSMTSSVKRAPKKARTRTTLIGVTIYQPDLEPNPRGRKLLEALAHLTSGISPGSDGSF
jgi:hypothetical protein